RPDGRYAWDTPVAVRRPADGKAADVAGIAVLDDDRLAVASTRGNSVQVVSVTTGRVEQVVPVGVAPYAVLPVGPDKWYVSNWGGDPPGPGDTKRGSSGTPVRVDPRTGVANHGSVSVVVRGPDGWKQAKTVAVGL